MAKKSELRHLPSVDSLLRDERLKQWHPRLIQPVRTRLIRKVLEQLREKALKGAAVPDAVPLVEAIFRRCVESGRRRVINATGVVLHTNLGRAPVGPEILTRLAAELPGYCSLEIDLVAGERGDRADFCTEALCALTGAESAVVVNNNAAALYLTLAVLAPQREALISRGELVQIGGGFRIPDILESSGATLRELGTTNITRLSDYQKAARPLSALVLKVHHSNFAMSGHTQSVELGELAAWARKQKLISMMDLGSGALRATRAVSEMTVEEVLRKGFDLVGFSGDKLLGGAQAGMVVGKKTLVDKLRRHPLYRVLRLGKHELFILEETLRLLLQGKTTVTDHLLSLSEADVRRRAEGFAQALGREGIRSRVLAGESSVGGGALPAEKLPTCLVEVAVADSQRAYLALLQGVRPVVVGRGKKQIWFDLRTVFPTEEADLLQRCLEVRACLS